jgi:hypothetical protein
MEEKDQKKSPEKKSESPPHINNKEEDINKINKLNLTEQVENNMKRKSFITKKLTKEFVEEEEEKEINIKYKEHGKKMVAISLDLLLKKIVNENFLEENPIKIYSFCQQCFCFIERDILFNKIFNCYDYYKNKKITMSSFCKLIKFLNVLVIEMFDYYITTIKLDDPIVRSLDDFYRLLLAEIIQIINDNEKEKEDEKNSNPDFNSKEFQNIIEDEKVFNENLISKDNTDLIQNRNCIYSLDEEKEPGKRERFNTLIYKNKDNANIKKEQNKNLNTSKNNNNSDDKTKNNQIKDTYKIKLKPETKKENKHFKNTNNKKEEKKGSKNVLLNIKKEKPVKLQNKNDKEKEKEKEKITPNINRINAIKKEKICPEEEIFSEIANVRILFSDIPKKRDIELAKKKINFYKDLKIKLPEFIGKPIKENVPTKTRHTLLKSVTVGNLNKKHKLKLHNNDKYFNILEWEINEIGEKLISCSKTLINKVQRREIYKGIFLKSKKNETSPNVMENIDKFNRLTFFIIQDILSYDFAKDRAKIYEKWVKIANYCKERKDYNDCIAINSALNNYIITGLNKTLNELNRETKELMKSLGKFCRYQGNYKMLREDMANLPYNSFYIPYLGMILKDIAFFEENSKYIINDVLINFEKLENVQLAVSQFFNFQNGKDTINSIIPDELWFFENLEDLKESDLDELANKLEPEFKLYANKKKEKRKTNIDKMYFTDLNLKKNNNKDNKNVIKK